MKWKIVHVEVEKIYEVYGQPFFKPWAHIVNCGTLLEAETYVDEKEGIPEGGFKELPPF